MTTEYHKYTHPEIKAAKEKANAAEKEFQDTVDKIQAACEHKYVIETPFQCNTYFDNDYARRMCLECGYEEEASMWPGHIRSYSSAHSFMIRPEGIMYTKLNSEFVKEVRSRDEFWKYRPVRI